jgi:thioredoxin 2
MKIDDRGVLTSCASCGSTNRLAFRTLGRSARCGKCQAALPPPAVPVEAGTAQFDAMLSASSLPIVVDFWAPWCGPCRMMAPEFEKVARNLAGEALVVKVNTDAEPELGERFGIRSIPTVAVFRGGREAARVAGARPAADIERLVASTRETASR